MFPSILMRGVAGAFTVFVVTLGAYLPGDGWITGLQSTKLTTAIYNNKRKKKPKAKQPEIHFPASEVKIYDSTGKGQFPGITLNR